MKYFDTFLLGTVLQMHRFLGPAGLRRVLRGLRAVYVSHLHTDHHLGLPGLLAARAKLFKEELDEEER